MFASVEQVVSRPELVISPNRPQNLYTTPRLVVMIKMYHFKPFSTCTTRNLVVNITFQDHNIFHHCKNSTSLLKATD